MFCQHVTNIFLYCYSSSSERTHTCWILKWRRSDKVSKTISFRHMCTSHTRYNTVQHNLITSYGGPTLTQIQPFAKFEYFLFREHRSKAMRYTVAQSVYALHTVCSTLCQCIMGTILPHPPTRPDLQQAIRDKMHKEFLVTNDYSVPTQLGQKGTQIPFTNFLCVHVVQSPYL